MNQPFYPCQMSEKQRVHLLSGERVYHHHQGINLAAITSTARGHHADLMDLHSVLMVMEDRRLNEKRQPHEENKELKMATLSLERERLAEDKARHDREELTLEKHRNREEQALEEHRRMEKWMKEEEMECKRREVSAKEDTWVRTSILEIARFVLSSVSGDTEAVCTIKPLSCTTWIHRNEI